MEVSLDGYRAMSALMRSLADELCGGRIVFVLEGGYAQSGVREGAQAVLESLTSEPDPDRPTTIALEPGTMLRALIDRTVEVHGGRIPGLGAA